MYTAKEIFAFGLNAMKTSERVTVRIAAGDPTVLAQLGAVAAQISMVSRQYDINVLEPFFKSLDTTVLAAAANRGVLPLGKSAHQKIHCVNPTLGAVSLAQGRQIFDSKGNAYEVITPVLIGAGLTATIEARQFERRTITNTVPLSVPFYEIPIDGSDKGLFIESMTVTDDLDDPYDYRRDYANIIDGEKIYNVEVDEQRRMIIRLGAQDAVGRLVYGFQPPSGMQFTVELLECVGEVILDANSTFTLATVTDAYEQRLTMNLMETLSNGANPLTVDVLRILSRYPTLNETDSAVYFNDYDYVFRKYLPDLVFLSVWNERVEEQVRGASLLNINRCFVAFEVAGMSSSDVHDFIDQMLVRQGSKLLARYDYVKVDNVVGIEIVGKISSIYDMTTVQGQIRGVLLNAYGRGKPLVSNGMFNVFEQTQTISALLKDKEKGVLALQDEISNFDVIITGLNSLPEAYRYLTTGSIVINLVPVQNGGGGFWNN